MFPALLLFGQALSGSAQTTCTTSPQCPFPQTCIGGVCLQSRGGGGSLQGCSFDYQCAAPMVCSGGFCVNSKWQCTRNDQCGSSQACLGGTCQQLYPQQQPASGYWCNNDAQCTVYETCQNYHCQECGVGQCLNRGSLTACWHDDQCAQSELCTDGLCRTKPCTNDNQCDITEVCDPTSHVCVDCTSQLTGYNPSSASAIQTASYESSGSCIGTGSGYWCNADAQCPATEVCQNSLCVANNPPIPFSCSTNSQCGYSRQCTNGLCVPTIGGGLSGGGTVRAGPCQQDTDCQYNQVCQNGACVDGGYAPWVPHN